MAEASGHAKVLVVDDEPNVLTALEDVLEDDFRVWTANSPERGLDILDHEPDVSVVISDQRMPGMTGDQFLATVKDRCHAMRILLTGYADLEAVIRAVNRGQIFSYISKPWDPDNLRLTVLRAHEYYRIEEELKQERNFLDALLRQLPDSVIVIDVRGRIQAANPAAEAMFGYSVMEMVGRNVSMLMPEKIAREHDGYLKHYLETGDARLIGKDAREVEGRRRSGSTFDIDLRVSEVVVGDRRLFIGTVRDITARKNDERLLREAKERTEHALRILRDTIESVPGGVALYDAEGHLMMVNEYFRGLYADHRDMIVPGMKFEDLVRARLPHRADNSDQRELESAVAARMFGFQQSENFTELQLSNGRWLHVNERRTSTGTVAQICTDVSLLKEHERDLQDMARQNAHLVAAIGSTAAGIILTDPSQPGNPIYFVNEAFRGITGFSQEECVGHNLDFLRGPETTPEQWQAIIQSFETGTETFLTLCLQRKGGKPFWAELRLNPVSGENGTLESFVGILIDITQQRLTERQLQQAQKMEAVGHLTGGVSHDFNNLLAIILGNLELLQRRVKDNDRLLEMVQTAIEATMRGSDLTRQLLAFSRKQALEPKIVNVSEIVVGMDKLLKRTLSENIVVKTKLAANISNAFVDPGQLESALLNLAINARDAMPEGGELHIETSNEMLDGDYVEAHPYVTPGNYVLISVTDTGSGIPKDVVGHIFEPFFTTKEVGKGTGLGLSMVYGFVKQSQGYINVYSEVGHGTTFKIYLPVQRNGEKADIAEEGPDEHLPRGSECILLVEDNLNVRRTAAMLLENLGYRVIVAEDGLQAMEILWERADIDLVFTDVVMPGGMSGPELAEAAKKVHSGIKILLTSGYTRDAIKEGNGFDVLPKPYTNRKLARKIREILET